MSEKKKKDPTSVAGMMSVIKKESDGMCDVHNV